MTPFMSQETARNANHWSVSRLHHGGLTRDVRHARASAHSDREVMS
jgi:hypothetical protein